MFKNNFLLSLLFTIHISHGEQREKTCSNNDCVPWPSCPVAAEIIKKHRSASADMLRSAFCGYEGEFAQVCCSEVYSDLEQHPQANLLPSDCGSVDGKRIVGGTVAGLYEFPWMVLISYRIPGGGYDFQCGGTLINDKYVLTAAHCVNRHLAGVRVGEHTIRSAHDCEKQGENTVCESHLQEEEIEDQIVHEKYQLLPSVKNDIALLRVTNSMDFSHKNVKPVCLPLSNSLRFQDIIGKNATVTGWGYTESRQYSNKLLKVSIPIHTKEYCNETLKSLNVNKPFEIDRTVNTLCAGEKGKDSCNADSGGPLMVDTVYRNAARIVQYGIVSYGSAVCGTGTPGVYTDIRQYMNWILDHIKP